MGNPVTHFEIVGDNADLLQRFYRQAFGWEVRPAGPTYAMVHPEADRGIDGGIGKAPEGGGSSRVTVYVEVDDLGASLEKIESLGGQRLVGPVDIPNGPSIALFRDPEGHVVGLTMATSIRGR